NFPRSCPVSAYSAINLHPFEATEGGVDDDTQALDDALAADGGSLEAGGPVDVEILFEDGDGQDIRKVALIPLHDEGEVAGVLAHAAELFIQLMEALQIFLEFACL